MGETGDTTETTPDDEQENEDEGETEIPSGDNETPVTDPAEEPVEDPDEVPVEEEVSDDEAELPSEDPETPVFETTINTMGFETRSITDYTATLPAADNGEFTASFTSGVDADSSALKDGEDLVLTVTPNTGYVVKSVNWLVDNADSAAMVAGDSKNTYKITKETLAEKLTGTSGALTFEVVTAQAFDVAITVDTADNIKTLAAIIDNGAETAVTDNKVTVESGSTLSLKVEPKDGFEAAVSVGGNEKEGTDNVYEIGTITEAVTVAITTTAVVDSYEITETIQVDGAAASDAAKVAEITYTTTDVTTDTGTNKISIAKGKDLTFKVAAVATETEGEDSFKDKVVEISYKIGGGAAVILTKDATKETAGKVYTIEKDKINAAVEIIVNVRPLKEVTVDTSGIDLDKVKFEYKIADAASYTELTADAGTITVTEGQTFSFKVTAKDVYQIDDVKVTNAELNETTEGYSFVATSADPAITVTTSYDKTKVNNLAFVLKGDAKSYTVQSEGITDDKDVVLTDVTVPAGGFTGGDTLLTQTQKIKVKLTPDASYDITKVALDTEDNVLFDADAEVEEGQDAPNPIGPYVIDFATVREKKLIVTTAVKTKGADVKVTFKKAPANETVVDYEVAKSTTVLADETDKVNDSYIIKKGEGYLAFTVTTLGKYVPSVKVNGVKVDNPEAKDGVYSYRYLVNALKDEGNEILIGAEIASKTVTLVYNDAAVDVSAAVGNTAVVDDGDKSATVDEGTTLSFKVAAKDSFVLGTVTKKSVAADAEEEEVEVTNGRFALTVDEDITVTITARGERIKKELTEKTADGTQPVSKDKKGAYLVSNTGTYVGGATEGGKDVVITKVSLLDSAKKEIAQTTGEGEAAVKNWSANANKTEITLFPSATIAGKALTLQMYGEIKTTVSGNEVTSEGLVAEYALSVSANLDATKVKVADIKQATDTDAEYPITVNAGAEVGKIKLDLTGADADIIDATETKITDGKLKVRTGFKAGETTVKLYTVTDASKPDAEANRTYLKDVKVTTTALLDKAVTKAPVVKAVNSTDVSITLSLDAKSLKLKDAAKGSIYYEITAKANGDVPKDAAGKALLKSEVTKCVEKTEDQQNTVLWFDVAGVSDKSAYGTGGYCKYDVEVRLVHLKDKTDKSAQTAKFADTDMAVQGTSCSQSATTGTKPFETKEPYYEDNLKLKKGASTVYTGQEDVVIATPQFGKNTSYMVVDGTYCGDITRGLAGGTLAVSVDTETNEVMVSADSSTALGKHTIQIVAISTDEDVVSGIPTMYASRATIVVTVVRGIENLTISVPSDQLYKDPSPKKAATMTAAVTYNRGATDKNQVPKAKKVQWALLNAEDEILSAEDYLNGKLTIAKNGKVALAKDYAVSRTAKDNIFKIAAIADDFKDPDLDLSAGAKLTSSNRVAISKEITITNDAISIGSLAILDSNKKVIARGATATLQASEAHGATLVAFIPNAPEKKAYTQADLDTYAVKAENVKFTSGNKALSIGTNGTISVNKTAKNVVLTAAPGDGNPDKNAKQTMKLTVDYDTTGELGLKITKLDEKSVAEWSESPDNKDITFTDSAVARFKVEVQQKSSEGKWESVANADNFTNFKLKVKGGKVLSQRGNTATIATSSAVTEITLTNSNVKPAVSTPYKLTNAGINALEKSVKAPKVTVKGSLKAGGTYGSQSLTIQLTNSVKEGKPGYIEDFSKLYVKTDFDWTTYNVKNANAQNEFINEMKPKGYTRIEKVGADGRTYLDFANNRNNTNLAAGSYKVKMNFGEIDEDGCFKSVAPAAALTLKVAKPKALSFKPVTSYKISATDSASVVLTGKGNYDRVDFEALQNANIKGKENKFTDYFALDSYMDEDGNQQYIIKLTEKYFNEVDKNGLDLSDKKNKDDLIGYVTYSAYQWGEDPLENTVKITMSVTAPAATITKYTVSSGVIGTAAKSKVTVYVSDNKKNPVQLAAVNWGGNEWETCEFGYNTIQFTAKNDLQAKGKYDIPIVILPASSYYVEAYRALKTDNEKVAFVNKYGVPLTVKVTANDLSTVNKGRITVDSKQLSRAFTASSFDGANYVVYVPFTEVYTGTKFDHIVNNSVKVGSGDAAPSLITVGRDGEYNYFKITMNKALLEQAIKADVKADGKSKNTFYDAKGKAKTLSVKADVCYDAKGDQKDSFTFKLTMPATRSAFTNQGENGLTAYEQAVDTIYKKRAEIAAKVKVEYDPKDDYVTKNYGKWAAWDLWNTILQTVGKDSGIDTLIYDDDYEEAPSGSKFSEVLVVGKATVPTTTADGTLPITVKLRSMDTPQVVSSIAFTLTIPKLETAAADVKTGVSKFLSDNEAKYAVNTVTDAQIRTDLRAYMKEWAAEQSPAIDLTAIRFSVDNFKVEEAGFTDGTPHGGTVSGKIHIWNIHTENEDYVDINISIPVPAANSVVIAKVKTALGIGTETGNANDTATIAELAIANAKEAVKADVLTVANKAAGYPYTVEYKKDNNADVFDFKEVGAEAGSISFTLVVKDGGGNYIGEEKDEEGEITKAADEIELVATPLTANADIMTVAEAKTAVEAWIAKVNTAAADSEDRAFLATASEENIVATVKTGAKLKSDATLSVTVDSFSKAPASIEKDGHVKGTVVLTKGGTTNKKEEKLPFNFTLAKTGAWTIEAAATAVTGAVADADIYLTNNNVKTDAGKAAKAAEILAIAKAAVPADKYDVAIKQEGADDAKKDVKLVVVKEATVGRPGEVSLALVITDKDAEAVTKTKDVTVTHEIPALEDEGTEPTPPTPPTFTASGIANDIAAITTAAVEATDVKGDDESGLSIETATAEAAIKAAIDAGSFDWAEETYTLTVTNVEITTNSSADAAGSATVTFTVAYDGTTSEGKTLTLVINQPEDVQP